MIRAALVRGLFHVFEESLWIEISAAGEHSVNDVYEFPHSGCDDGFVRLTAVAPDSLGELEQLSFFSQGNDDGHIECISELPVSSQGRALLWACLSLTGR